ncbi:MAG: hypothetical protein Q9228_006045 [Teloschistes exilis]
MAETTGLSSNDETETCGQGGKAIEELRTEARQRNGDPGRQQFNRAGDGVGRLSPPPDQACQIGSRKGVIDDVSQRAIFQDYSVIRELEWYCTLLDGPILISTQSGITTLNDSYFEDARPYSKNREEYCGRRHGSADPDFLMLVGRRAGLEELRSRTMDYEGLKRRVNMPKSGV